MPKLRSHLHLDSYGQPREFDLSPIEARATLPGFRNARWRKNNPELAAYYRFHSPDAMHRQLPYRVGQGMAYGMGPNSPWVRASRAGAIPMGLLTGGIGAGTGWLIGKGLNLTGKTEQDHSKRLALILGSLFGGVGAMSGYNRSREKRASDGYWNSFKKPQPREVVLRALRSDTSLSMAEQSQLAQMVEQLSRVQQEELARLIERVGGGMVGVLIAKYLMNAGPTGQMMGGLLGSFIAPSLTSAFGSGRNRSNNTAWSL
jgi:uncharacterized membrane protein YeaQ/YmgE (transglycosylase-associated protein family)